MADIQPPEPPANGGLSAPSAETLASPLPISKRQRRPSVRLGEIGDQPAAITSDPHHRRSKPRPQHHYHHQGGGSGIRPPSKTRPLTTLAPPADDGPEQDDRDRDENFVPLGAGIRRAVTRDGKPWRGARRVRSSWVPKADEGIETADLKSSDGEDAGDEGAFREDPLSASPSSDRNDRRTLAVEVDVRSETDSGDWNDRNGGWRSRSGGTDGGVRSWLDGLGLGRYAPVFEIHEVDEVVLPLLTLEDLKDMGINAVGSRRKMLYAIQKLRKNLTQ